MMPLHGQAQRDIFERFRTLTDIFEPMDPPTFGTFNEGAEDELAELAALLYSVESAGERYRMVALGAAPGEWAVKAERSYRVLHPRGDFFSVNLEGDIDHVEMTKEFMVRNGARMEVNDIRYQVVGDRDGFAYFPIINPDIDWGAGLAAIAERAEDLDDNITISDSAKADREGANGGKPLEYRTVPAVSLTTLLGEFDEVDYLHCDIQGAEGQIFGDHMAAMSDKVRLCCIATHGKQIEVSLRAAFEGAGWTKEAEHTVFSTGEGAHERVFKDGVFVWSNPKLARAA